ncbi:expressed unknown protein [Seminavis robusta]|uniref:Uncharacterized protein n=1 Tax=Seminavis robusta TaxID=568900 RepID=A0A9N8F0R7_9STRA|nr:expressed unknown protein [Seminavis robusta]|eukprot:Sro3020_g342200.1 n/a (160) ;mRNA; r:1282-1829
MIMYTTLANTEPTLVVSCDDQKISRKRSRSCGFTATVTVVPTVSTSNSDNWYNDAEAQSFKANVKRDVVYLAKLCKENRLRDMDHTEFCSVGVERYCCAPATRNQTKAMKEQRVRAVLQQQAAQRAMGIYDPEAIRAVATGYSEQSRDRALQLAARLCQ